MKFLIIFQVAFASCSLLVIRHSCLIATHRRTSPNNDIDPVHHSQTKHDYSDVPHTVLHNATLHRCHPMQGLAADIGFTSLISVQPCNSPVNCQQHPVTPRPDSTLHSSIPTQGGTFLTLRQALPGQASSWCLRLQPPSHDRRRRHFVATHYQVRLLLLRVLCGEWSPARPGRLSLWQQFHLCFERSTGHV
jgi:hypothetical protein